MCGCKRGKHEGQAAAAATSLENPDLNAPSSGEKPPFRMSSKSHSCLSVSTMACSFSASSESSLRRGASRAIRSLRTPPASVSVSHSSTQKQSQLTMGRVGHVE